MVTKGISRNAMNKPWRRVVRLALADGTPLRAFKLALVVGSVLVVINQWEALWGERPLSPPKLLLTYIVPYLVSTYTAVAKDLWAQGGQSPPGEE